MTWRTRLTALRSRFLSPRSARLLTNVSRQVELVRERIVADQQGRRDKRQYEHVETFTFFLGFPRSGHTLVGAMLNSHPEIVMAHEANAFRLVQLGISREGLYRAMIRGDERFRDRDWKWQGFDYTIPGQFQGRWTDLRVVGDKKGRDTTIALMGDPGLLRRLQELVKVPVRSIVVVRNPYDNIARMALRSDHPVLSVIWPYRHMVEVVQRTLDELGPESSLVLRHESVVDDPMDALVRMTSFLGVACEDEWAKAAAGIVFGSPRRARDQVEWSSGEREVVAEMIERFPLLDGYEF